MKTNAAARRRQGSSKSAPRAAQALPAARETKAKSERATWRRTQDDQSMSQQLGLRVRAAREAKGLSLAQLSEKSGIPDATLSRIENNKMSPTFGLLARVMMGLEIDWVDLMGAQSLAQGEPLLSFAEPGGGTKTQVRGSTARVLHQQDTARNMQLLVDVRWRDLAEAGGLIGHKGEEFCYVLSGKLILHLQGHPPRVMKAGASALFQSSIPHAYLAGSSEGARILLVVTREFGFVSPADKGTDGFVLA
jgi:transcriptional regulator with XRE-family HTH domain